MFLIDYNYLRIKVQFPRTKEKLFYVVLTVIVFTVLEKRWNQFHRTNLVIKLNYNTDNITRWNSFFIYIRHLITVPCDWTRICNFRLNFFCNFMHNANKSDKLVDTYKSFFFLHLYVLKIYRKLFWIK